MNKDLASILIAVMLIVLTTVGPALIGYVVDWLHVLDFLLPNSDELNINKFGACIRFWLLGFLTALIGVVAYLIFGLALSYADQILKRPDQ